MSSASPVVDGPVIRGVCPLDLVPLEPIRISTDLEVQAAVAEARTAHEAWMRRPFEDRVSVLQTAARAMLESRGTIIDLVRLETGKLEVDGLFTEGLGPIDVLKGWIRVVKKAQANTKVRLNPLAFPRKQAYVDFIPRGVVGVIAPWNFPVAGLYRSVYPALLTGNGVVVKPSEYSPRSSAWFIEKLQEHLPAGLIGIVQGGGQTGAQLVESDVDSIVFTGSAATGQKVAVACAEKGIPSSIEMGGNDAAIVLADADLSRTAAGITQWALQNAGQACGAIEVAYIEQKIADQLIPRLVRAWSVLRVGPGPMAEVDVSPLANERQLSVVDAHVEDARAKGAAILCGGKRTGDGLWYEPTLIDNCTEDMDVVREETFGPVLALRRVEGAAEAIRHVNRGRYGLTASLWTADIARAERLAPRLGVGVVTINNHAMTGAIPDLPWSGTRASGFSVANSQYALHTYTRPQAVLVDRSGDPEPFWLPVDRSAWELGELLADAQLFQLRRAWRLPALLRKRVKTIKDFFG